MSHSHSRRPDYPAISSPARSGSPVLKPSFDSGFKPSKDPIYDSDWDHQKDLNIKYEGWLNKCNVPSSLSSLSNSNSAYTSAITNGNWRLVRAVLSNGTITIFKPPSDLAVKFFDKTILPTLDPTTLYNDLSHHTSISLNSQTSENNHNPNKTSLRKNHKRIISALSNKNQAGSDLQHTFSHSSSISTTTSSTTVTSTRLLYQGSDPHPDLVYDKNRIVDGTDEAICHTILFGSSTSFAKTAVLLLPLLTDIVRALDILTAYTDSASNLLSDTSSLSSDSPPSHYHLPPFLSPSPLPISATSASSTSIHSGNHVFSAFPLPAQRNTSVSTCDTSSSINSTSSLQFNETDVSTDSSSMKPSPPPSPSSSSSSQEENTVNTKSLVSRLKLITETMQDHFPGMFLHPTIFEAFLKLIDSISLHSYQASAEIKKSAFLKQKQATEILSYSPLNTKVNKPTSKASSSMEKPLEKLENLVNSIESQNRNHFSIPASNDFAINSKSSLLSSSDNSKYGNPNFYLQIPPETLFDLDINVFANQIYQFDLSFFKTWSPTSDISLLFNTDYSYNRYNPLVFDSTNLHFLSSLLVDHLFNVNQKVKAHAMNSKYRADVLNYWIDLGNALKACGDMVGWLSIATVICSIPVLRLSSVWCHISSEIREQITKEWAPVVFDLERHYMISEVAKKSSFHVLAPQGIGKTYPKELVIPYFGDLTVKFEPGSSFKQCETRLNHIYTAFDRWESYLDNISQKTTFDPLPDAIPILQRFIYSLFSHNYESKPITPDTILKMSLVIESNYLGQYFKYYYSQKSFLSTGAFSPLLFTTLVPAFRLIPKSLLLNALAHPQTTHSKRTLLSSSSHNGEAFKSQNIKVQNHNQMISMSQTQPALPEIFQSTGCIEIDSQLRSFMTSVSAGSSLLQDIFDILNVGTCVFHLGNDIILKKFDEETTQRLQVPRTLNNSSKGTATLSDGKNSHRTQSHGSPQPFYKKSYTINTVVKAANLERLVDILILGVCDFSSFLHDDDLTRYPEIILNNHKLDNCETSHPSSTTSSNSSLVTSDSSSTVVTGFANVSVGYPVFTVDMDVYTMTFFAIYRRFCSVTILLESFRKRFAGAPAASLSIVQHMKNARTAHKDSICPAPPPSLYANDITPVGTSSDNSHFPNWDSTCNADPEVIDWRIVAQIQIGILEACHHWVSKHFSDFSNDLAVRDQFLDLLRSFEVGFKAWKDSGILRHDDYKYYYDTLEVLHKKIRKLFIKKSYRPVNIKKLLPVFPVQENLEWIPLDADITELEVFIDDLDSIAAEYFNSISMRDWMEVVENLESHNSDPQAFFNYKHRHGEGTHSFFDIYSYLESLKIDNDVYIFSTFPKPIRSLFKFRNNLISFFTLQVSDPTLNHDKRVGYMESTLKILGILRKRMSILDIFFSDTNPTFLNEDVKFPSSSHGSDGRTNKPAVLISPHIPSFLESAIATAVVSSESRLFANSWLSAARNISDSFDTCFAGDAFSVDTIVPEIPEESLARGRNDRPNVLTPCIGWLFERLLEIVLYLPNMALENTKLINFDKHRYTYNIISSVIDIRLRLQTMEKRFKLSEGTSACAAEFINRMSLFINPKEGLFFVDRHLAHQVAARELKEFYPRSASKNRVFHSYVVSENEKTKRDSRQREVIDRQSKSLRKANHTSNKPFKPSLDSPLAPDLKRSKSRFGGFLKAVRPISMAFSGSFTPMADRVVHPDELPELSQMNESKFKQLFSVKVIDSEVTQMRFGDDRTLFRISNKGVEYWFQAPSEEKAEEWVRSFELSRSHSNLIAVMSPNSSKVFGVPISIVCNREKSLVPTIVETLLNEIEKRGLREVGIYRVPGSLASVNALKAAFDSGEDVDMKDDRWYDVNTVTGCFKLYLRELPHPLLTSELLGEFVSCSPIANTQKGIKQLRRCVKQLPAFNYNLLKRLVEHLSLVTAHGDHNKMHAVNLAIVFSMSLIPPCSSLTLMNADLGSMQTILKTMIIAHDSIFGDSESDDESIGTPLQSETSKDIDDVHLHPTQTESSGFSMSKLPISPINEDAGEQLYEKDNNGGSNNRPESPAIVPSSPVANSSTNPVDSASPQSDVSSPLQYPVFSSESSVSTSPLVPRSSLKTSLPFEEKDDEGLKTVKPFDSMLQYSEYSDESKLTGMNQVEGNNFSKSSNTVASATLPGNNKFSNDKHQKEQSDAFNSNAEEPKNSKYSLANKSAGKESILALLEKNSKLSVMPPSNSKLISQRLNKRFSSMVLPSEYPSSIPGSSGWIGEKGPVRRRALDLEEGISESYISNQLPTLFSDTTEEFRGDEKNNGGLSGSKVRESTDTKLVDGSGLDDEPKPAETHIQAKATDEFKEVANDNTGRLGTKVASSKPE